MRFIHGNFGNKNIAEAVGHVDGIIMFDVLLHQVSPHWDRILEMYAAQTRCFIIFNPQWVGSGHTVRLLDFGEEEYFKNVPHVSTEGPYNNLFQKLDQKHPVHEKTWRDAQNIWQWGITDTDLQTKVKELGFRLQYCKNCGQYGKLTNFENHAYIFSK
jgi:hypothetical protein